MMIAATSGTGEGWESWVKTNLLETSTAIDVYHLEGVSSSSSSSGISTSLKVYRVCVCLIGMVGVLGNGLVFVVMVGHPKLRKLLTSTLIANQSLVDMVCGLSLMMTYGYKSTPLVDYRGMGRELLCFLFHNELLLFCALNASTYCLMVITLERYLMIVTPIYHRNSFSKRRAIILAAVGWLAGFLWNGIPTGVTTWISSSGGCILYNYTSYHAQQIFGYVYITATFFLPMLLFGVAYTHMLLVLHRRVKQVATTTDTGGASLAAGAGTGGGPKNCMSRAQVNLTKTMVLVTAAFALCWTPNQILYFLFNTGVYSDWGGVGYIFTLFLAFLNCCINPFIYAVKYDGFRKAVRNVITCNKEISSSGNSSNNGTTRTGL